MKGKRIAAFALTLVLDASAAQPALAADWQSKNPLIAHALGEADGKIETNSKEAFLTSWQNGFRAVEADFTYTSDGTLVVRHDFEKDGSYSTDKKEGWQMFDAGVAAQTFALAAHAQGVGTVMLGIYDAAYIQEKLGIPQTEEVAVLLAAGYEKFTPDAPTRKTAEDVLRFV